MASATGHDRLLDARNPYALAQRRLDREVGWRDEDAESVFETAFDQSYETLFDPRHDSPVFASAKGGDDLSKFHWQDLGDYTTDGVEVTDPLQHELGDCYFMAALAATAWTRPDALSTETRQTADGRTHAVEFYEDGLVTNGTVTVEVTEMLPILPPRRRLRFGRSTDRNEIWPGVYQKAYAKWKTGIEGDRPDMTAIEGGSAATAVWELTGVELERYSTTDSSTNDLWAALGRHCRAGVATDPAVAWTYSTADDAPGDISYASAALVANHAYTVLGRTTFDGAPYFVLRNPWGKTEPHVQTFGDWLITTNDALWQGFDLDEDDGVFALPVEKFAQYYQTLAVGR